MCRIERNLIEGNGARRSEGRRSPPAPGAASSSASRSAALPTYGQGSGRSDRPALLVAGNVVDAPNGRALKAILLGPAMVLGNRLTGAGRSALQHLRPLIPAVFALSRVGSQLVSPREEIDLTDYVLLERLADVLGGDAVKLISLCVAEESAHDRERHRRGGRTATAARRRNAWSTTTRSACGAFHGNFGTVSSVLLLGMDDVSFCDNQAEVENDVNFVTNVLAVSATLRLSTNRLQEGAFNGIVSAFTFATMNQTSSTSPRTASSRWDCRPDWSSPTTARSSDS